MIHFVRPEAFLLAAAVVLRLRRRALETPLATALRAVLLLALVGILADPHASMGTVGRDLVVVVDRSRSVPAGASAAIDEQVDRAAREARDGDRVGVVLFGRRATLVATPREAFARTPLAGVVDADGTDLAEAIDGALAAIPPDRPGSLLLLSDGESTGTDPELAARRAARRGIRVDAVPLRRAGTFDVAVEEVSVPPEVAQGEPLQVAAWIRSDRPVEATVRLLRDGVPVAEGKRTLRAGSERVLFRDVAGEPGLHEMAVEVLGVDDRVPENDRARAALRVEGRFRVLCVTPEGRADRLTESLRSAGIDVVVRRAADAPLSLDRLEGFRAVVLEDVPAQDLPPGAMDALGRWVEDQGGGLLMTGGRASFGPGGYHHSPVARVLPVSLEMRQEQRKFALAMAIALDRSGSMMAPAAGGPTKMDLANRGAVAAIDLLTSIDAVTVIAVDSSPHLVVPLTPVSDRGALAERILSIESMGGGIFVEAALHAAAGELRDATQATKHIVLFADAADSEEPGDYAEFVPKLRRAGITLSVIGLGTEQDSDAELLRELARLGGGRVFFSADAADLPRVFAQETIEVARSAVVEEPCEVAERPDLVAIGALPRAGFPSVGGYTIAYAKPGSQVGLLTEDDVRAPLLSFWQRGLGRSAAFLGVADGPLSGDLSRWDGYAEFFATVVRWVAGTEAPDAAYARTFREGHQGVLAVEVERGNEALLARLLARVSAPDGTSRAVDLVRTGATRLEGRFPLDALGVHRATLDLGDGRFLRAPPLLLPYSPEFEPRHDPSEGENLLRRLALLTGGRIDPPSGTLFDGPREGRTFRSLVPWFALVALLAFLAEIAVRRTSWSPRLGRLRPLLARLRPRRPVRAAPAPVVRPAVPPSAPVGETSPAPAAPVPAPPEPPPPEGIASVLERAKRRRP